MKRTTSVGAGLARLAVFAAVAGVPLGAQQSSVEAHANFARTTQTHLSSWGGGTQYQLLFGGTQQPVQLGSSLGVDYQKQEKGGPSETSGALDVTRQPGHPLRRGERQRELALRRRGAERGEARPRVHHRRSGEARAQGAALAPRRGASGVRADAGALDQLPARRGDVDLGRGGRVESLAVALRHVRPDAGPSGPATDVRPDVTWGVGPRPRVPKS